MVVIVAPPPPTLKDDPAARVAPASTSAPLIGSMRDRMARAAERTPTANEVNDS